MSKFTEGDFVRIVTKNDPMFGAVGEVIEIDVSWERVWITVRVKGEESVYASSELRPADPEEATC